MVKIQDKSGKLCDIGTRDFVQTIDDKLDYIDISLIIDNYSNIFTYDVGSSRHPTELNDGYNNFWISYKSYFYNEVNHFGSARNDYHGIYRYMPLEMKEEINDFMEYFFNEMNI